MNGCSDDACFRWLKWIGGVVADAKAADAPSAIMVVLHSLGAALAAGYEDALADQCHLVAELMDHRVEQVGFEAMVGEQDNWRWN
jgi:hypothetical protein